MPPTPPPAGAPRAVPPAPPAPPAPPTPPPNDGAVWIEDGDGTQVYIARTAEAPEAVSEQTIELIEVPAR
jgi:hypothetical protein